MSEQELPPEAHKSPRRGMCAGILGLESIALGLSSPVMIFQGDVDTALALGLGLGLAVACIVVAGMLRKEWAYAAGWAIQVGALAIGLSIPIMFLIGGIFTLLWGSAYFMGRRIEEERAEAWARWAAEQQKG